MPRRSLHSTVMLSWAASASSPTPSPTKSRPEKWWNGPPASSKSCSKTRWTPGATEFRLDVEAGGRRLIRLADNGCGHAARRRSAGLRAPRHQQAFRRQRSALDRHAGISRRSAALDRLGIAAAARNPLARGSNPEPRSNSPAANSCAATKRRSARGTTITVRDLFFNVPARKKFLRSEQTEIAHIASLVTHYSLAHPGKTLRAAP